MKESSLGNFGLLIAYVVPGLTSVWGASYFSDTLRLWLYGAPANAPTVGGFLYVTIASIAAGVTVSAVRWAIIDTFHHHTGIPPPDWDFSELHDKVAAYRLLLENHYNFFQFYSNMLVAVVFSYLTRRTSVGSWSAPIGLLDIAFLCLVVIFLAGSRDSLRKYYTRGSQLFGPTPAQSREDVATPNDSPQPPILSSTLKTRIVRRHSNQPVYLRQGGRHAPEGESGETWDRHIRADQGHAQETTGDSEGTQ